MHADNIHDHQRLEHEAVDLVTAWARTDPMTSEDRVRQALAAGGAEDEDVDALLPYVVDAARARGLLVESEIVVPRARGSEPPR